MADVLNFVLTSLGRRFWLVIAHSPDEVRQGASSRFVTQEMAAERPLLLSPIMKAFRRAFLLLFSPFAAIGCGPRDGMRGTPRGKVEALDSRPRTHGGARRDSRVHARDDHALRDARPQLPGSFPGHAAQERRERGDVITATRGEGDEKLDRERKRGALNRRRICPACRERGAGGRYVVDVLLEGQDGKPSSFRLPRAAGPHLHPHALPLCPSSAEDDEEPPGSREADRGRPGPQETARLLSISFDVEFGPPEVLLAFGSGLVKDQRPGPCSSALEAHATGHEATTGRTAFGLVF